MIFGPTCKQKFQHKFPDPCNGERELLSSELRPDNIVYKMWDLGWREEIYDIWHVSAKTIESMDAEQRKIYPIRMTEEWCHRLGFAQVGINQYVKEPILCRVNLWIEDGFFRINSQKNKDYSLKCEFVHEIQNRFFELSKEELTIHSYQSDELIEKTNLKLNEFKGTTGIIFHRNWNYLVPVYAQFSMLDIQGKHNSIHQLHCNKVNSGIMANDIYLSFHYLSEGIHWYNKLNT